jgi:hypothetical protein
MALARVEIPEHRPQRLIAYRRIPRYGTMDWSVKKAPTLRPYASCGGAQRLGISVRVSGTAEVGPLARKRSVPGR